MAWVKGNEPVTERIKQYMIERKGVPFTNKVLAVHLYGARDPYGLHKTRALMTLFIKNHPHIDFEITQPEKAVGPTDGSTRGAGKGRRPYVYYYWGGLDEDHTAPADDQTSRVRPRMDLDSRREETQERIVSIQQYAKKARSKPATRPTLLSRMRSGVSFIWAAKRALPGTRTSKTSSRIYAT